MEKDRNEKLIDNILKMTKDKLEILELMSNRADFTANERLETMLGAVNDYLLSVIDLLVKNGKKDLIEENFTLLYDKDTLSWKGL